mmetsp:Transcript_12483/g.29295  ORF Transcript_12483/g.29295 Transcript_12483/m.29295 type:complete len:135 (+) Transcript_12483:171-575(+)|eukprot:CAMPEP_0171109540 /NCGR_PEP_ID=MMETSP0766_2-20121228/70839_1 /TAXON_ID=439317 /ORGANISM="Gambierdiscus australes, Strain CAWD 149" /LENGTH=134 /DNA_ID=CAMNT_0011571293 /DNA_START=166 /DNA_END=570 /DNA_ORIENTATION=-
MSSILVGVISAQGLPNADWLDKSDPYCTVTMAGAEVVRTKVVNNDLNPVWNEEAHVKWDGRSELVFTVMDSDLISTHDKLGEYVLPVSTIRSGFKGTVQLSVDEKMKRQLRTSPTLKIKLAPPDSNCCGGCSVM